jgi:endonuclease YncB( thermonuclease family)
MGRSVVVIAVAGLLLAAAVAMGRSPGLDSLLDADGEDAGRSSARRAVVARVVDGDTVELASGRHVRLIGVDTPERDSCGYEAATRRMQRMVEGRRVRLVDPASVQDRDAYGRLLRFVDVSGKDTGLAHIRAGLAVARYDSTDGYDPHPREARYHAVDRRSPSRC